MADIVKREIQKNINLYYIHDAKYKTVSMSLFLHRRLDRSEATKNALLAKVLRRGTEKYPAINKLNQYAEELYGTLIDVNITKKAYAQSIVASVNYLAEAYLSEDISSRAVELMLDLIFKPYVKAYAFDSEIVSGEKQNLRDDIESLVNDKRSYANFRCIEEMCKGEDTAIFEFGYLDDIDNIDENNLYTHYRNIAFSSPIDIFAVGDMDIDKTEKYIKDYLSAYKFDIMPIPPIKNTHKKVTDVKYTEDSFDVAQGKLAIGLRTGISIEDDLYYALLTANSIFGGGAHSRLFNTVREKMSLCYYAGSKLDKFRAIMLISSGIEFENFDKAKDEILRQLRNISEGDFTDEEFNVSKSYIINSYMSYKDSPYLMKDYYSGHCFSDNHDTLDEAIAKVRAVTRDDVVNAFSHVEPDTVYFLKGRE